MVQPTSDFNQSLAEIAEAVEALRRCVRTILDRLMPDGYGARSCGRSLGLERMTGWRIWTLARVSDHAQALRAMPGHRAWQRILDTFKARGVPAEDLETLRLAIARIEPICSGRRVDRVTLRAIAAGGLDSARELAAMRDIRRSTSHGNARIYGVHAKALVNAWIVAPARRPRRFSLASVGIAEAITRSRPGPPWTVAYRSAVAEERGRLFTPLGDNDELPTVISALSTGDAVGVELRPGRRHEMETIELGDGAVSRNGRLRLCFGEWMESTKAFDRGTPIPLSLQAPVLLPTDLIVFDLLIHRRIARHTEPAAAMYGSMLSVDRLPTWQDAPRLPLGVEVQEVRSPRLPKRLAAIETAYTESIGRVFDANGTVADEYHRVRLILPYPPLLAVLTMNCDLLPP